MKKNVIVSLADSNYFELLSELIDSIKRGSPKTASTFSEDMFILIFFRSSALFHFSIDLDANKIVNKNLESVDVGVPNVGCSSYIRAKVARICYS